MGGTYLYPPMPQEEAAGQHPQAGPTPEPKTNQLLKTRESQGIPVQQARPGQQVPTGTQ